MADSGEVLKIWNAITPSDSQNVTVIVEDQKPAASPHRRGKNYNPFLIWGERDSSPSERLAADSGTSPELVAGRDRASSLIIAWRGAAGAIPGCWTTEGKPGTDRTTAHGRRTIGRRWERGASPEPTDGHLADHSAAPVPAPPSSFRDPQRALIAGSAQPLCMVCQ